MRRFVYAVGLLPQLPLVWGLGHAFGHMWMFAVAGALLSVPFLTVYHDPFDERPRSAFFRHALLTPFYVWWTAAMVFLVASPLTLVGHAVFGETGLSVGLGLSFLAGLAGALNEPRLVEHDIEVPGLPKELDGYRIAQISDIHCGAFTPPDRVRRWVDRLNAAKPDLVAVTGDLITSGDRYTEVIAEVLGGLRGRDGVFMCMGNHDYFTDGDVFADQLSTAGLQVLRNDSTVIRRNGAVLFVAGVDDTWTGRADLEETLSKRPEGASVLLLAHDPNSFPEAASEGVHLTLSGHTHGGQIAVPGFSKRLTPARLITRFPAGFYRQGDSTLYVSCGAGTTGPPVRIGARAELTVLTLRSPRAPHPKKA